MNGPALSAWPTRLIGALRRRCAAMSERLSPRQRQFGLLGLIVAAAVLLLWLVLSISESGKAAAQLNTGSTSSASPVAAKASAITNIGVLAPGAQVSPVDQWVGTAGRKLAQYESERDEQTRLNKDRQAFEARTMQRFAELEQRLQASVNAASQAAAATAPNAQALRSVGPPLTPSTPLTPLPPLAPVPPPPSPSPARSPSPQTADFPPAASLPQAVPLRRTTGPASTPLAEPVWPQGPALPPSPPVPTISRVTLADRTATPSTTTVAAGALPQASTNEPPRTTSSFLPVSFTRGVLLGGLDAPTGGQAQSNPHPVLIRLSDTSVLPNRVRGDYRECFVIAAGYGDISSERAYLRTESLSCVRSDGTVLELRIQGSVYGEDGKVGLRGRLVTKQGQMLANALLAGVVSGIGQGVATASTNVSSSALGTVAQLSGQDALRAGVGSGVGRALDRLAQYYIKLAENTFPIIEVDAGREIDVVITRGSRIDLPAPPGPRSDGSGQARTHRTERNQEAGDDGEY
ncbi:TraB/VirB10 family protein [Sphaerotilus microaerophilus]|nr:TraB/VirB10 family protein [Sphaerotilus sp. FB-5]